MEASDSRASLLARYQQYAGFLQRAPCCNRYNAKRKEKTMKKGILALVVIFCAFSGIAYSENAVVLTQEASPFVM